MSNLPSLLGAASPAFGQSRRELGRVERAVSRDVALVHGRGRVLAERGRANAQTIESVAIDAMQSGTQVARHATALAHSCPIAEGMLRGIVDQTGMALSQIVSDTARDLR